jgi:glycolate oxidase FAD binding subunit
MLAPADEREAAEIVSAARRRGALDIVGGGTKPAHGRPREGGKLLSMAKFSGLVFHEPAEMILRARAGATLAEVEASLAQHNQMLPFEPMDPRRLWGSNGEPTIGGLVATALAGPRRISAGAVRDSLIGVKFVNGAGEVISSGGRVMKNVTGLDLVKIQCGAHGALGLILEATFKLMPCPPHEATLVLAGLDNERAGTAMSRALSSPYRVSGAAMLPEGIGRGSSRTFLRLEGFEESVVYRLQRLEEELAEFGVGQTLTSAESQMLWRAVRDVEFLAEPGNRAVWRISIKPSHGAKLIASLGGTALASLLDWGGGLAWVATEPWEAAAAGVRAAARALQGHATLMRADEALRRRVPVFEPPSPFWLAQTKKLKASFDPDGVFNPGRMYEGV